MGDEFEGEIKNVVSIRERIKQKMEIMKSIFSQKYEENNTIEEIHIHERKYKWKMQDIQQIQQKIQSAKEIIQRNVEILQGFADNSDHSNEEIIHIKDSHYEDA